MPGTAANAHADLDLGLDEMTAGLVLGGTAISVYAGRGHLRAAAEPGADVSRDA